MSTQPEKQTQEMAQTCRSVSLSRRDFLRSAGLTMAGLSAALLLPKTVHLLSTSQHSCKHCGAVFQAVPETGSLCGGQSHCPNCGINLASGRFDLAHSAQPQYSSRFNPGNDPVNRWNYAQVPFPNSKWVLETEKPSIQFSEIHL